jgi:hypothetical protein
MSKHTPLPWSHDGAGNVHGPRHAADFEDAIADCAVYFGDNPDKPLGRSVANARFIVRACNSYLFLVESCERALRFAREAAISERNEGVSDGEASHLEWMLQMTLAVTRARGLRAVAPRDEQTSPAYVPRKPEPCATCGGSGLASSGAARYCVTCGGSGTK